MHLVNGFVKIQGASDLEDAPVAAGICVLTGYKIYQFAIEGTDTLGESKTPLAIDLTLHLKQNGFYQRCNNSQYLFSRDQTIALWSGFKAAGRTDLVSRNRVDGKDWFLPGNLGHERRCKGESSNAFFDWWLRREIDFHAHFTPLEESNQLIAQMVIAGPDYVRQWTRENPKWRLSILNYWRDSFRNETDFALHLVNFIEGVANGARLP